MLITIKKADLYIKISIFYIDFFKNVNIIELLILIDRRIKTLKVHCFFEQSGTFKNAFKSLGIEAIDYDLYNKFGQTDVQTDLFKEIENAYNYNKSVFDNIEEGDLIFAFFPCVRFDNQITLSFAGISKFQKGWSDHRKLVFDLRLFDELRENYFTITKLVLVCLRYNLKLIIENPYTQPHFLTRYWAIKPAIIDTDRSRRGDYFKKPTQFFFINTKPKENIIFEPINVKEQKKVLKTSKIERSLISFEYAVRFIKEFIL